MRLAVALLLCMFAVGLGTSAAAPATHPPRGRFVGWAGFTPGGHYLQVGQDRYSGRYYDLHARRVLPDVNPDEAEFAPDDSRVAIAHNDGVHLLDIASGAEIDLPDYLYPRWSRDGKRLTLTGGATGFAVASGDFTQPTPLPYMAPTDCLDLGPATISNDGAKFAYVETILFYCDGINVNKNVPGTLLVKDVTGGAPRDLDEPLCGGERFEWSADSRWLATENAVDCEELGNVDPQLHLFDATKPGPQRSLTRARNPVESPVWAWAPKDDWIAYVVSLGTTVERAGGGSSVLLRGSFDFAWSPDATRLVVVQRGHVRIVTRSGRVIRTIGLGRTVDWSRATGWISYIRSACGPQMGVHLVRPDGSHDHRLPGAVCTVPPR